MSTITVTGRLTRDTELRFTPTGKAVLHLGIAENHSRRLEDGSYEDTGTTFYNVTRWAGRTSDAEVQALAEGLHRGDLVVVIGQFRTREYQRDGETRRGTELVATEIAAPFRGQTVTITRTQRTGEAPVEYEPADYDSEPSF